MRLFTCFSQQCKGLDLQISAYAKPHVFCGLHCTIAISVSTPQLICSGVRVLPMLRLASLKGGGNNRPAHMV